MQMVRQFGEYLREKRQAKGMSIRQLALYAGCSDSYLSLLERDIRGTRGPTPDFLKKLSKPLGVPYEMLMIAAGYYADFRAGVEFVPAPLIPILRESLQDSQEQLAQRLNMTVDELSNLEEGSGMTVETASLIFDSLFARQRTFSPSNKAVLHQIEQTFEHDPDLGHKLETLIQWFFESHGEPRRKRKRRKIGDLQ